MRWQCWRTGRAGALAASLCGLVLGIGLSLVPAVRAFAADVDIVNASRKTACAEEDNVYVQLQGPGIRWFGIRAEHPHYAQQLRRDSTAPDFTACDMSNDPRFAFQPRRVLLYRDANYQLVGHTFRSNWRPESVEWTVGQRREPGLHLVQLSRRVAQGWVEVLVVYPSDGYWRIKPLPPRGLRDSAFGSSFLFGPIEEDGRPLVRIAAIHFDPAALTFRLQFRNGGQGFVRLTEVSPQSTTLALELDPPLAPRQSFAALRSMFVTPQQADVAVASWPARPAGEPILAFGSVSASSIRFGRQFPSKHNLSAPDLVFDRFE
jgi:hypothetical protein